MCSRPDGAAELLHQVSGAIDETLGIDCQALQQFRYPLGNLAAFAGMQAAAGKTKWVSFCLRRPRVGVLALFALAQELNFKLVEPEYLPQKRSPDSGSGSLRGRPDLPGVTRRPSAAAISSAKRALPKAKLPLLA